MDGERVTLVVLLAAILGGAAAVSVVDERAPLGARLAAGAPVGLALLGLVGFALALAFGLSRASVMVATLLAASPVLLWLRPRWRPRLVPRPGLTRRLVGRLLFWGLAGSLCWAVFDRVFVESPAGIATGCDHNLGDLPFHLAIVTGFVYGENIPPEHPELAGVRLTYPFLVDFVAAMLVATGASLRRALLLENLVLALSFVALLQRWALRLTRSRGASLLTPAIVLFSGGLGFWVYLREGGDLLGRLLHLSRDYTISWSGDLRWGNALVTLFVPQRALLFGAPLVVLAWLLVWRGAVEEVDQPSRRRILLGAGLVAGLLPLVHVHGFVVALGVGGCLALLFRHDGPWVGFFVGACALAAPPLAFMALGSAVRAGSFVGWEVGWDHGKHPVVWFWLFNTGLFLPLLAIALWLRRGSRLVRYTLPFLLFFVVPNLLKLSPWIWDNVKFLFFWFVGSAPLVALLVARLGRHHMWRAAAAAVAIVVLTLSGCLDVWRMASRQIENRIFDADGVAFGEAVRAATEPHARVLQALTYDSPLYLSGRPAFLGYLGHISSQGLDLGDREAVVRQVYAGAREADELLRRERIDYLIVGPRERTQLEVNEAFLSRFAVVAQVGGYRLQRVR